MSKVGTQLTSSIQKSNLHIFSVIAKAANDIETSLLYVTFPKNNNV